MLHWHSQSAGHDSPVWDLGSSGGLSASSLGNLAPIRRRWLSAVCDGITVISLWVVILQLVRYQFDFNTFRPDGPPTVVLLYRIPAETI